MWPFTRSRRRRRKGWISWLFRTRRPRTRRSFYRTAAWIALREATKAENMRWHGRKVASCERCGARPDHWWPWRRRRIHVDHILPRSRYPAYELDPRFLQALCARCNTTKGARNTINWRRLRRWHLTPIRWALIWWQRLALGWRA